MIKLTLVSALLAACVGTGPTTVNDEKQAGADIERQFERQIGLYPAEFLTSYVDAVGRRLVSVLGTTNYYFRFKVIDRGELNAFAAPGGYIYVTRGLLAMINSEDELAGILAHEIIHVKQRHHPHQANRDDLPEILTLPGQAVEKAIGEDIGNALNASIVAAGYIYNAPYELNQENEADRLGMQLAARAGYDPSALADVFGNLELAFTLLTGKQKAPGFFDSHPSAPARIANIEREASSISWKPGRPFALNREALLEKLDGLTWGADNPMQGILRGRQFMHPDMDLTITFPDGWDTINTPEFVGAFAPEQQAVVIFSSAEKPGPAEVHAKALIKKLRSEASLKPAETHPVDLDIGPAWLVRIEDASGKEPVSIDYLWVNARNTTFQIFALGTDTYREPLRKTVMSLRNLTDEEKNSIAYDRIRYAPANTGETIFQFSTRTGNRFSPELTAAVNGVPVDVIFEQGQLIKILSRESYFQ